MSPNLNIEQFVEDYRSGLKDRDLLVKYSINAQEMVKIVKKLIQVGQISKEDYFGRTRRIEELETRQEKDFLQSLHHCPVCSHIHPTPFRVCPACGTDVTKFGRPSARGTEAEETTSQTSRPRVAPRDVVIAAATKSKAPRVAQEKPAEHPEPEAEPSPAVLDQRTEKYAGLVGLSLEGFSVLPAMVSRIRDEGYHISELASTDTISATFKAECSTDDKAPPLLVRLYDDALMTDDQANDVLDRLVGLQSGADDPNLLKIVGSGTVGGRRTVVYEYMPSDLQKLVDQQPEGIDADLLQYLLPQILNAVGYCHLHRSTDGMVARLPHMYLRPSSFFFDPSARTVKLIDCGLWKSLARLKGYPKHLSEDAGIDVTALAPEGFLIDAKFVNAFLADIYALGVPIYRVATGLAPFECASIEECSFAHLKRYPVPPRVHRYAIPRWLDAMILKCLEKEPARRWRSATQMELAIGKDLVQ